jgi:hypothetical protein
MSLWRSLQARDRGALTEGAAVDSRTFASDWPEAVSSDSRQLQIGIPRQVLKGGSHLCAPSHCRRYRPARPADRQFDEPYRLVIRERSRDELPPFSCCREASVHQLYLSPTAPLMPSRLPPSVLLTANS